MTLLYPQALMLFFFILWRYQREQRVLFLSLALLIIALTRPVLIAQNQSQKLLGKECIIALDVSASMKANDILPNRLESSKNAILKMLETDTQDRFSLFAFTTNPLILSPSTSDHTLLLSALHSLKVENILTHGTDFHTLLQRISKLPTPQKNLLLFSDGGEMADIAPLISLCQTSHITVHAIASGTDKGTFLKDTKGKKLKDKKGNLIITRLNPKLKKLAQQSGGSYTTIEEFDPLLGFLEATNSGEKERLAYLELFWIPTLLALFLFLFHFIHLPKKLLLILPFLAPYAEAGLLDWYHISQAKKAYHDRAYKTAISHYEKITSKTIQSMLNLANSYYQAGDYTQARRIYLNLKTTNPRFKKEILFKLANCAVMKKEYDEAKALYFKALRFGKDDDILANLRLIADKKTEQKRDFLNFQTKNKAPNKAENERDKKSKERQSSSGKPQQQGAGKAGDSKANNRDSHAATQASKLTHPLGYRAYELINKGYLDEKTPW